MARMLIVTAGSLAFFFAGKESVPAGEFDKPYDTVGYADCFGSLKFTSHLGAIQLSRAELYNFYIQYSSYSGYESPFLGKGFFVPLLEAVLIDNDYYLQATTLGGSTIYMYRLPAEPDKYVSLNGENWVTKLGGDKYLRENKEGFALEYHEGQLNRVKTPDGTQLVFEYDDDDVCRTVRSSTGVVVCSVNRTSDTKCVFKTAKGTYNLEYQVHPISNDTSIRSPNLPPLYTLKTIQWPNGAETEFTYTDLAESGDIKLQMRYQDDVENFIWNKQTGLLSFAAGAKYQISPLVRNEPGSRVGERTVTGMYTIRRSFEDGTWELYSHDEDAGYSDEESSGGEIIRTHYINTRGPVFNKVSKRERIYKSEDDNIADKEVMYQAFYDAEGNLLREVREGKVTWHLRKDGIPISMVKEGDNLIRYDNRDRMVYSRINDSVTKIQWLRDDASRVVATHPWGEIHIRYYDEFGNAMPIPSSENFEELSKF